MTLRTAILGATGAVGEEFLRVLAEREFPVGEIVPVASRADGRTVAWRGEDVPVRALAEGVGVWEDVDVAFFSAGAGTSRAAAPDALRAGAIVVDNSSAFRMDDDVPLVVPEANPAAAAGHRLIANPNCSTILLAVAVAPIHRVARVRRAVVATYQAVSGAGARALAELDEQRRAAAEGREGTARVFAAPIDGNVIPRIGDLDERGVSGEEAKMERELRKILGDPGVEVSCTCVRVPVRRAHSEAIHLELEDDLGPAEALEILREAPGVRVTTPDRATPLEASGTDDVLVSRVRRGAGGLDLWICGDQLRKGAALNAVQISELILKGSPAWT